MAQLNKNGNNCRFNYYKDKVAIGEIIFNIDYNEINICWITIFTHRGKGYGTKMLAEFKKYVLHKMPIVKTLVLIPKDFNGTNKNNLCNFYEKNGFIQEYNGHPTYICKIV
jgi:GNAT superfamily N-acetyltransferase